MVDKLCPTVRTTSFLASILRQTLCKFLLHHKNAYALSHCQANTKGSITGIAAGSFGLVASECGNGTACACQHEDTDQAEVRRTELWLK